MCGGAVFYGSGGKKGKGKKGAKAKSGASAAAPADQKLNHSLDMLDAFSTLKVWLVLLPDNIILSGYQEFGKSGRQPWKGGTDGGAWGLQVSVPTTASKVDEAVKEVEERKAYYLKKQAEAKEKGIVAGEEPEAAAASSSSRAQANGVAPKKPKANGVLDFAAEEWPGAPHSYPVQICKLDFAPLTLLADDTALCRFCRERQQEPVCSTCCCRCWGACEREVGSGGGPGVPHLYPVRLRTI